MLIDRLSKTEQEIFMVECIQELSEKEQEIAIMLLSGWDIRSICKKMKIRWAKVTCVRAKLKDCFFTDIL